MYRTNPCYYRGHAIRTHDVDLVWSAGTGLVYQPRFVRAHSGLLHVESNASMYRKQMITLLDIHDYTYKMSS